MPTDETGEAGRYVTLRDYLSVIRRYAVIIVTLAIVGGVLGYLDAKRQTPTYNATASVSFTDPNQSLGLVGYGSNSVQAPSALAASAAQTVDQPYIVAAAARQLKRPAGAGLGGSIAGSVSATSANLLITASATNPTFAARLANAVAQVVAARSNASTATSFSTIADGIQARIASLQAAAGGTSARANNASQQLLFYDNELARIDTLKQVARSAQVATVATPPSSASSPKTARSIGLGIALGLLLGLLFAFVRDTLDRRLGSLRDVETSLRLPVLGHVRNETMGRIPYSSNGSGPNDRQRDIDAFMIVRRNLEFLLQESAPRSVLVTSGLPEEGKTTVAASMAYAMAVSGKKTLLVDCDFRRPALSTRLGLPESPGISDFLAGKARPEEILRTVTFGDAAGLNGSGVAGNGDRPLLSDAFVCIPAGSSRTRSTEMLGSEQFQAFMREVREVYDVVILDSSPLLPVADSLELLPHVDAVVFCVRQSQTTRTQAAAAKAALSHGPERPTGVVFTGVKPGREEYSYYSAYSGA